MPYLCWKDVSLKLNDTLVQGKLHACLAIDDIVRFEHLQA